MSGSDPIYVRPDDDPVDRGFLERLVCREASEVSEKYRRRTELEHTAGNSGNEIRDWLVVAKAMPEHLRHGDRERAIASVCRLYNVRTLAVLPATSSPLRLLLLEESAG